MGTAVVFAGGPVEGRHPAEAQLPVAADLVVAVDSGLELAESLGRAVDLVVGDMDSVSPDALARAELAGAVVRRHPVAKDETDLELAMEEVHAAGVHRVVVLGSDAGRLDHLLGAASTISSPRWRTMEVEAWFGAALLVPVHDSRALPARRGALVSLLALHGPATGVRTHGLRWPLDGDTLEVGSSRGVSNEVLGAEVRVSLDSGSLVAVLPDGAGPAGAGRVAVVGSSTIGGVA